MPTRPATAHRRHMPSTSPPTGRNDRSHPAPRRALRDFLHDLRLAWSLDRATDQPVLRDYPLRRPGAEPR